MNITRTVRQNHSLERFWIVTVDVQEDDQDCEKYTRLILCVKWITNENISHSTGNST